jgi:iron complex transport system substrate-binding protein
VGNFASLAGVKIGFCSHKLPKSLFFGTLGGSSVNNPQAGGSADLEGARSALEQAVKTSGCTGLTAYGQGHIILVDGSLWTSTGGPLLMNRIIDAVEEALL